MRPGAEAWVRTYRHSTQLVQAPCPGCQRNQTNCCICNILCLTSPTSTVLDRRLWWPDASAWPSRAPRPRPMSLTTCSCFVPVAALAHCMINMMHTATVIRGLLACSVKVRKYVGRKQPRDAAHGVGGAMSTQSSTTFRHLRARRNRTSSNTTCPTCFVSPVPPLRL